MGRSGGPALESLSVQGSDSAAKGASTRRVHSVNEQGEMPYAPGRTLVVGSAKFAEYEKLEAKRRHRSICWLPVLSPVGKRANAWGAVAALTDVIYTGFMVPIAIGWGTTAWNWITICGLLGSAIYVSDIIINFHTGFLVRWDLHTIVVQDGRASAWFYIRKGTFWIDIIAFIPIIPDFALHRQSGSSAVHLINLLRLVRLLRLAKVMRSLSDPANVAPFARWFANRMRIMTLLILKLAMTLAILLNLLGSLWWFIADIEGPDADSWTRNVMNTKDINISPGHPVNQWLISLYFATEMVTTIGFGDIVPVTSGEIVMAVVFMLVGVGYFGYLLNAIADLVSNSSVDNKRRETVRTKMRDVEEWMAARHLATALKRDIRRYYLYAWAHSLEPDDGAFYDELPIALRGRVAQQLQSGALRTGLLGGFKESMDPRDLARIKMMVSTCSRPMRLSAGRRLYCRDDEAYCFYVLDEGEMAASTGAGAFAHFLGPASVGVAAVFAGQVPACAVRQQSVQAVTTCRLWRVDCRALMERLEEAPALRLLLLKKYRRFVEGLLETWEGLLAREASLPGQRRLRRVFQGILPDLLALEARWAGSLEGDRAHAKQARQAGDGDSGGGEEEDAFGKVSGAWGCEGEGFERTWVVPDPESSNRALEAFRQAEDPDGASTAVSLASLTRLSLRGDGAVVPQGALPQSVTALASFGLFDIRCD